MQNADFRNLISLFAAIILAVGVAKAFLALHEFFKNQSSGRPSDGTEWAQIGDAVLWIVVGSGGFLVNLFTSGLPSLG